MELGTYISALVSEVTVCLIVYLAELMVLVISSIRVATSLISTSNVRCSLDKTDITYNLSCRDIVGIK